MMELQKIIDYCSDRKGATEDFPFDETTMVFKIGGKMFALLNLEKPFSINLKCDPDLAEILRERYTGVTPGYHMNKKHWNTVALNSDIPEKELIGMIDHSYQLIFQKLTSKLKDEVRSA